jgi:hypothetical protein
MALPASFTLRREPVVFGDVKMRPLFIMDSVRPSIQASCSRLSTARIKMCCRE